MPFEQGQCWRWEDVGRQLEESKGTCWVLPPSSSSQLPLATPSPHSIKTALLDRTSAEINQRQRLQTPSRACQLLQLGRGGCLQCAGSIVVCHKPNTHSHKPSSTGLYLQSAEHHNPCPTHTLPTFPKCLQPEASLSSRLSSLPLLPRHPCRDQGGGSPISAGKQVFNERLQWMAALSSHHLSGSP